MIIHTPRLCNDVAFLPPQTNKAHPISCKPIVPDLEIPAWIAAHPAPEPTNPEAVEARLDLEKVLLQSGFGSVKEKGSGEQPVIIGGIAVGAHSLVGEPGKVIQKSVVAGGGKETLLGTIADSSGKTLSKEEMRKLDIRDPKDVERLKGDLESIAGGKGWRLDLVDTPRGREFRGVVDADEDEEEEKGEAAAEKGEGEEGTEETYKEEL